jgi:hypothetical protein
MKENFLSKQYNIHRFSELAAFFKARDLYKVKNQTWPIVPRSFRQYKLISEYIPIKSDEENV